MTVAADIVFVQPWFLLAIQNHGTIATVCNRLATGQYNVRPAHDFYLASCTVQHSYLNSALSLLLALRGCCKVSDQSSDDSNSRML